MTFGSDLCSIRLSRETCGTAPPLLLSPSRELERLLLSPPPSDLYEVAAVPEVAGGEVKGLDEACVLESKLGIGPNIPPNGAGLDGFVERTPSSMESPPRLMPAKSLPISNGRRGAGDAYGDGTAAYGLGTCCLYAAAAADG